MRREIRPGPALVRDCDLQFGSDQIGIWMVAPQASPSACCVHGQGNISPIFRWHQKKVPQLRPATPRATPTAASWSPNSGSSACRFSLLLFLFFFFCQSSLWSLFWRTMFEHQDPLHTSPTCSGKHNKLTDGTTVSTWIPTEFARGPCGCVMILLEI